MVPRDGMISRVKCAKHRALLWNAFEHVSFIVCTDLNTSARLQANVGEPYKATEASAEGRAWLLRSLPRTLKIKSFRTLRKSPGEVVASIFDWIEGGSLESYLAGLSYGAPIGFKACHASESGAGLARGLWI